MKKIFSMVCVLAMLLGLLPENAFATEMSAETQGTEIASTCPYLQQLPENFTGCSNLYDLLTPLKGYYTATKYDTSNGDVLSVVIPVEPGDRIAASSFGPVSENMGSVAGIRVTYLLDGSIVKSLSASSVYSTYTQVGYLTVPEGVNMVSVPWWAPSNSNWLTLAQISKNYATHSPKVAPAQAPTCTERGYTAGEICEFCDASLGSREEIAATGHDYIGNTCTVCGTVNVLAILDGKYVSILGDSISTFNGYSNDATVNSTIGGNGPRYDAGAADTKPGSYCLLESVNDTWWMHFANRSGMKLLVNNSWAGSQVFGGQTSDGRQIPPAYLERCINLHDNTVDNNPGNAPIHPDVIFVYLGINDYNFNRSNVGNGAVDYAKLVGSDGTYAAPTTFGEAYGILLHKMQKAYPAAQIFAMTLLPENLYSVDMTAWAQHNAYIRAAAEYYHIPLVDLAENCAITWENYSGYMIDKIHPTTAGMELISDCIEAELVTYYKDDQTHIHTPVIDVAVDANCTETGLTEGSHCEACGEILLLQEVVPATGHTYEKGTCIRCGISSVAMITDEQGSQVSYYTTLAQALKVAVSGQTVSLRSDVTEEDVTVSSGVQLDLNGYTLTANSVLTYNSSAVVDSSSEKKGLLKINDPKGNMICSTNCQLPVYDGKAGGYRFFAVTVTSVTVTGNCKYWFKIEAENFDRFSALIQSWAEVLIKAKMTWEGQEAYADADLAFTKRWAQEKATYITVAVDGAEDLENFTLTPCITSGGVEIPGEEIPFFYSIFWKAMLQ